MSIAPFLAFSGLIILAAPAQAERFDCSGFRNAQAQFACYDNLSRAPSPEPRETLKPYATKPRAATVRHRKLRTD
jgi:hypothetical protein